MTPRTVQHPPTGVALLAITALAMALSAAGPASAQTIVGTVIGHEASRPVQGVAIRLLDTDGQEVDATLTGEEGEFRMGVPEPGTWRIVAERIGFATARSETLELEEDQFVTIEIRLTIEAVPLDEGFVVLSTSSHTNPDIRAFHERREQGERTGIGHFLHGDELRHRGGSPSQLFRMIPGVTVSRAGTGGGNILRMRGGCIPSVFIDGNVINHHNSSASLDTYVDVNSIEGIEVYRGAQQPGGRFFDRSGCGVVLVWTKRGERQSDPFTLRQLVLVVALVGAFFLVR